MLQEGTKLWIQALEGTAEGRASLSNLLHDCTPCSGSMDYSLILKFLKAIGQLWKDRDASTRYPEDLWIKFFEDSTHEDSDPKGYLCQGRELKIERCSRVMDVEDLAAYNLELDQVPFPINGHLTEEQVEFITTFGLGGVAKGEMRGRRTFAWLTKSDSLDAEKENNDSTEIASVLRDKLGLKHFEKDEHLIEVRYPDSVLRSLRAPTFLDGCPSIVYRSKNGSNDRWGRAVDLSTLEDGLPEAVHESVPFTEDYKVVDIGCLRPMKKPFDWESFLNSFPHIWQREYSINKLEEYLTEREINEFESNE